jgi:hypothetical protein
VFFTFPENLGWWAFTFPKYLGVWVFLLSRKSGRVVFTFPKIWAFGFSLVQKILATVVFSCPKNLGELCFHLSKKSGQVEIKDHRKSVQVCTPRQTALNQATFDTIVNNVN